MKRKLIHSMPLCSRCSHTEITNWLEENHNLISEDVRKSIVQELKAIKLCPGECLVCKSGLISDSTSINILKIMEENKVDEKVIAEFLKDFFYLE